MNCPIISILREGEGCLNKPCHHNMFWDGLKLTKKAGSTEASLEFFNCMTLLSRELTLEEIGEMWGMSRERIRQIERDATIKLLARGLNKNIFLKELKKDLGIDRDIIKKRHDRLLSKKYNKHQTPKG